MGKITLKDLQWVFPLKVVRGHEGFQLEDSQGRMICDGMTSRDAAALLLIIQAGIVAVNTEPPNAD